MNPREAELERHKQILCLQGFVEQEDHTFVGAKYKARIEYWYGKWVIQYRLNELDWPERIPNALTLEALEQVERGEVVRHNSVEDLIADLTKDED